MVKTISHFLKNIGFNMIADLSTKLVNSVLILLLSHFLGVSDMGSYSVAHTYFSFGLLFSYWGFGNLLTREVARDRTSYSKYLSNFGVMRIIFSAFAILTINIIVINLNYVEQTMLTIQIISISILANTIINLIHSLFIAFEELKYLSAIALSVSLLRLLISYIVLRLGGSVVTAAIFYTSTEFISLLISGLFALRFLKEFHFEFNFKFSINQIKRAFPFFVITILAILDSRVEILIISLFFNDAAVGYYTAMNTIMGGIALFSEGIRNAIFPLFARYQINDPEKLTNIILMLGKYITLVTFPVSIGVFFYSEEIIALFFRQGYEISATLLQIVVWTFISYSITVVAIRLLMVYEKENRVVFSLFISGIMTLVLNLLFAPKFGLVGVATARLITSFILFFICIYFIDRQGFKIIEFSVLMRIIFASFVLFLVTFMIKPINAYLAFFPGIIIYSMMLWGLRVIRVKDLQMWKNVFHDIFSLTLKRKNQI